MKPKWGRVLGFSLNNNHIRKVDRYLIIPWRGNVEPINIYLCVLLILGMKTNVITPRNNRIISASHLSCSQPLLPLLLSLCNVKTFGEAAAGAGLARCTTAPQYGEDTHSMLPNPRPAPAPTRVPIIRVGVKSTPHRVSPLRTPGVLCPAGPRLRAEAGRVVVLVCGVVLCCAVLWRRGGENQLCCVV